MNPTSKVMRAEASRLRSLAGRLDEFADELDGEGAASTKKAAASNGKQKAGEYSGMTQTDAVLEALKAGPQTTLELFERLNAGGKPFKTRTYVTALLPRIKDKVERSADGKIHLKNHAT